MMDSTSEKIAVFAPIPKASVSTAVRVKPGDFRSCRNANFRSFSILSVSCKLQATLKSPEINGYAGGTVAAVVRERNYCSESNTCLAGNEAGDARAVPSAHGEFVPVGHNHEALSFISIGAKFLYMLQVHDGRAMDPQKDVGI
jgi:hypothetical protein